MKKYVLSGMAGIAFAGALAAQEETGGLTERYRATANKLIEAALADHAGMEQLTYLCDRIGNRLSGSPALEKASCMGRRADEGRRLGRCRDAAGESSALGAWQRKRRRGGAGEPAADDPGSGWKHRDAEGRHHGAGGGGFQLRGVGKTGPRRDGRQDRSLQCSVRGLQPHGDLSNGWSVAGGAAGRSGGAGALRLRRSAFSRRTPARSNIPMAFRRSPPRPSPSKTRC